MKKNIFCIVLIFLSIFNFYAQEELKSTEEEYYDFLSLSGIVERSTLNYRTLSDSVWTIKADKSESNIWKSNNLGHVTICNDIFSYKVFGPSWFNSYNSSQPFGQNDGALWQGVGYNTSLTGGVGLYIKGFSLILKPQICFSQNSDFDIMTSGYDSEYGYFWSYAKNVGIDCPQRFGDSAFWTFDWGDSEIRYTWKNLTLGFGTQAIWLGPAWLNPILSSNNAATYPKIDFGLKKTSIIIPKINWNIGQIEARIWNGYLSESDYFDNDDSNNHNMINALSFSYAPSFLPGLTLGLNRIFLTKWKTENFKYIGRLFTTSSSNTVEDQKASFTASWLFPSVGFELFGELGLDDYTDLECYLHTVVYTVGLKKSVLLSKKYNVHGEIIFEWNNLEMSQDYQLFSPYSFYFHSIISQGYTNKGQIMGAGSGSAGNSQYIGFRVYYPKGTSMIYFHRYNPDTNYVNSKAVNDTASNLFDTYFAKYKVCLCVGIQTTYFVNAHTQLTLGFMREKIRVPYYNEPEYGHIKNYRIETSLKYNF